jgi:hypothetical protein
VPTGSPRGRASRHAPLPTGRGYLTGRTATGCRPGQAPALPPRDAWLVLPSPPRTRPNRDGRGPDASAPRRLPSRVHSTNLLLARLAIDRIVKETTDATGRCDPPVSGGHAGRFAQFAVFVLTSGEGYDNREITEVNTPDPDPFEFPEPRGCRGRAELWSRAAWNVDRASSERSPRPLPPVHSVADREGSMAAGRGRGSSSSRFEHRAEDTKEGG